MHPNPLFRSEDRAGMAALVDTIGFGMIFAQTPIGPRVVHTPLVMAGEGRVRFHISRANALAGHLDGASALAVVNGPDGYISPRWYADRDTVPTWDYVALELEGPVRPLGAEELEDFLRTLIARSEARLDGAPWLAEETSAANWTRLLRGILGFEMAVKEWRPTYKLSQKKSVADRARIADGLIAAGNRALAETMAAVPA